MFESIKHTLIGRDGTEYRESGIGAWFIEAFESFFAFFGLIAVGCALMSVVHFFGLI